MAVYWWGGTGDKRKIHWAKWDKLTGSKMSGGLDFRDLNAVNEALLAKQVWRLLQEPNLLMFKVLKERYFPNRDFLQTQVKRSDSWLSKSWLGAKQLVDAGMNWRVGDGKRINIWDDRWLPNTTGEKVTSQQPATCHIFKVCDLMDTR